MDIVPGASAARSSTVNSPAKSRFPSEVIVSAETMRAGCQLVLTEQGAFLDGHDLPENHQAGWGTMLDNLHIELRR